MYSRAWAFCTCGFVCFEDLSRAGRVVNGLEFSRAVVETCSYGKSRLGNAVETERWSNTMRAVYTMLVQSFALQYERVAEAGRLGSVGRKKDSLLYG